tara:strand:- start:26 stop:505 length:480 start_codon:yes stop_codon:yes gene_type:complete
MKECFKCHEVKPVAEYYAHPRMKDGHLGKCKACTRKDAELRRARLEEQDPEWKEREKKRKRELAASRYVLCPEKTLAHNAIKRLPKCKEYHWHHWSYLPSGRKDVIRLLAADHRVAHTRMIYDQERHMYRGLDGVLLDSRESHIAYLVSIGVEENKDAQ